MIFERYGFRRAAECPQAVILSERERPEEVSASRKDLALRVKVPGCATKGVQYPVDIGNLAQYMGFIVLDPLDFRGYSNGHMRYVAPC
jgi:hypothetical protein